MLGLKLIHVSKSGHWYHITSKYKVYPIEYTHSVLYGFVTHLAIFFMFASLAPSSLPLRWHTTEPSTPHINMYTAFSTGLKDSSLSLLDMTIQNLLFFTIQKHFQEANRSRSI